MAATLLLSIGPTVPPSIAQTIDTIVVRNSNVFDRHDDAPGFLARLANALHIRTQAAVIRRTLLVNPGEPYDSARVAESERALRALDVFRRVELDTLRLRRGLALRVTTADGWSTKPQAGFSSAGGDQTWEIGIVEQNLLGTATELAASYRDTPDRRILELQYRNPHFLFRRATLLARYADLSDGRRGLWQAGVPFFQTAARRSLEAEGEAATERVLLFRDGFRDMTRDTTVERRVLRFGLRGGVALSASSRDYARLWLAAQWRREDYAPRDTVPFPRSVTMAAGVGVEIGHVRFRVLEHFNSYARREDVDVSQVLRVGMWGAPRGWGYDGGSAGIGPEIRAQGSAVWRGGFVVARLEGNAIVGSGGLDSGRVRARLTTMTQNLPRQTLVLHLEGGVAERPRPGGEFDPWLDQRGPRLFGAHAFTGTRTSWVAFEDRILVADEVWGLVAIGLAPFLDWGGAWYADEPVRRGGDVGVSLRLGPTRSVRGEPVELALGWRFGDGFVGTGWALAVRQGIRF